MTRIATVNFNTGEISPDLDAREDIEKYSGGCRKLENMIPDVYGDATKRPGTEFVIIGGAGCYFDPPTSDPDKIQISTAEELAKISWDEDYPADEDYELANDIDCSGVDWNPIGSGHPAEGSEGVNAFSGTLDGRYYTISNISYTMNPPGVLKTGLGLFGEISGNAVIQRVILENCTITNASNTSPPIGLFVGKAEVNALVTDCYAQGTITVGNNSSLSGVGGFVGSANSTATYTRCGVDITMTEDGTGRIVNAGGFVGSATANGVTFTDCYAQGTISGTLQRIGGFVGTSTYYNTVKVYYVNCYAAVILGGTLHSTYNIGGFAGYYTPGSTDDDDFTACFWDGTIIDQVTGKDTFYDWGKLPSTTAEGDVADGEITESTTTPMQTSTIYTNEGWDFTENTGVWQLRPGDYPRHQWRYKSTECIWIHN